MNVNFQSRLSWSLSRVDSSRISLFYIDLDVHLEF